MLAQEQCAALIESMFGVTTSDDYRPVAWMGRYPVDVTTILVAVHALTMIVGALLIAAHHSLLLDFLSFDSAQVLHAGFVWQIFTYVFVHAPTLWFALYLYMLFFFGREVERAIGRRGFILLYCSLVILPTLLLTVWALFGNRILYSDSDAAHFAIFVAFAAIYPNAELIFRIQAKWMALVGGGIVFLQYLMANAWPHLSAFIVSVAFAFVFIRSRGIGEEMHWLSNLKARLQPKPKFHIVRSTSPRRTSESEDIDSIIDPLLEKISKYGINSLTASERKALDRARNRLLKKSQ